MPKEGNQDCYAAIYDFCRKAEGCVRHLDKEYLVDRIHNMYPMCGDYKPKLGYELKSCQQPLPGQKIVKRGTEFQNVYVIFRNKDEGESSHSHFHCEYAIFDSNSICRRCQEEKGGSSAMCTQANSSSTMKLWRQFNEKFIEETQRRLDLYTTTPINPQVHARPDQHDST